MTFNPIRYFALSFFLLASTLVLAQNTNFGLYAGPSFTKLKLEPRYALPIDVNIDPYDFKTGVTVGGFFTWNFANNVGVRTELNYDRKGGKSGLELSDGNGNPLPGYTIKDNFDYFQVPVMLQLSAGDDFKMHIHIGYAFCYLLHRTDKFPDQIRVVTPTQTIILLMPEDYKDIDHSIVAGIGASYKLAGGMQLQAALRAFNGKLNISKGDSAFEAKNLAIGLLLGVGF
ncbi:MAG: PorT family protein [Saprospiraceae bacterium]|nr:PorT family protein [Saprospiraceae bacterium]MCF8248847.1 PorT family protein [Saprospiraceae bacterium]MCF8279572.1 PorT family protein [Bacteroidales bacterium]MCF8310132.1 PorT family protein [Saprospiraceae bacterium]MCF8439032.1 PorT family protein [Saprospiraceae bacterium]